MQALVTLSILRRDQADFASDAEGAALIAESNNLAERAVAVDPDDPNALIRPACARVFQGRRAEAWPPWVEGARLAGFPVTDAEALASN